MSENSYNKTIEYEHSVIDSDITFNIDPFTRKITSEQPQKYILMQGDHKCERFTINIPRYIEGHDMYACNSVNVHFLNMEVEKKKGNRYVDGVYTVADLHINEENPELLTFSWLISGNATFYAGKLGFFVTFSCLSGIEVDYRFVTDSYTDLSVVGKLTDEAVFETLYVDIIEQWKEKVMLDCYNFIEARVDAKGDIIEANLEAKIDREFEQMATDVNGRIDEFKTEVDNHIDTFDQILRTEITNMDDAIDVLEARMNTFTSLPEGSTIADGVLKDMTVGTEGEVYDTPAEAVRGQFTRLSKYLDNLIAGIVNPCGRQILDFGYIKQSISIDIYTGVTVDTTEEYYAIDTPMLVDNLDDHYLIYDKPTRTYLYFYSQTKEYLGHTFADSSRKLEAFPADAKYVKIVFIRNGDEDDVSARNIWLLEGNPKTYSTLVLNDGNVSEEKCSFFVRDLLKQDEVEYGMVFNPSYGDPYEAEDRSLTGYIDVVNVRYITTDFTFYIAYYDENFVFISDLADVNKHNAGVFEIPTHEQLKYARLVFVTDDPSLINTYHISNCEEVFTNANTLRKSCLPADVLNMLVTVGELTTNYETLEARVANCENETLNSWYKGKTITAFGDSITEGNKWQPYVADKFNCTMVNCGIGGTTVANNGSVRTYNDIDIESWMCSDDRINLIPEESDVILLFGGANDWSQSIIDMGVLGDGNLIDTTFKSAYSLMIKKLVNKFPNAKLIALTPINGRTSAEDANEDKQYSVRNLSIYDFAVAVKEVCMYYGIPCIDVHGESGINTFNHTTYIADIVHPNDAGGKLIANAVINGLKRFEPIDF